MPAWGDKGELPTTDCGCDCLCYEPKPGHSIEPNILHRLLGCRWRPLQQAVCRLLQLLLLRCHRLLSTPGGVPHPSNPGGPGQAVSLTGDANSGQQIFAANCVPCHAAEGKGGVANPGSTHGTVPALNPIDPALKNSDKTIFATNLDLFIEHGSTPAGPGPTFSMPPWGDKGALTPQQIADVIAYLISLNP